LFVLPQGGKGKENEQERGKKNCKDGKICTSSSVLPQQSQPSVHKITLSFKDYSFSDIEYPSLVGDPGARTIVV
jgi:hypothetical protein